MQSDFVVRSLKALETLDRCCHHLSYQGGPVDATYLDCFDLGRLCLKNLRFKPRQ